MNFLPAFYFPTTLVCVDDTQLALEGYKHLFADHFKCLFFHDADSAQKFFDKYDSPLDKINFLSKVTDFESERFNTQSVIQLDIAQIIDLAKSKSKYNEVSVLLSDYYMLPGINGLDLCKALKGYKFKKMLLTENQTYETAREALNSDAISYFANKTDPVLQIKEAVQDLATSFFCDFTNDFRRHLETNSSSPLSDSVFVTYFQGLLGKYNISEYYLIDKNGSYLLVDNSGKTYVLIVHNDQSLTEFTDILSEYADLHEISQSIKNRKVIPFLGIGKELCNGNLAGIAKSVFEATPLKGKEPYYLHLLEYNTAL